MWIEFFCFKISCVSNKWRTLHKLFEIKSAPKNPFQRENEQLLTK